MPPDPDAPRANPPTQEGAPLSNSRVPLRQRVRAYRLLWILALLTFVADQASKLWIVARVPYNPMHAHGLGHDTEIIRGFFYIIHVGNTGAAWSMFAGRSILLACLAVGTLVAIYFWRHSLGLRDRVSQISFGLLCGGIVGNLVDRLVHKHVIDFIDLHFGSYIYPTFNIADSGICVGVILYLWQSLRVPAPGGTPPSPPSEPGEPRP
jgi:signal peptidase II